MIDNCRICEKKPATVVILIAEPGKLRANVACKSCAAYLPPKGKVRELATVVTVGFEIPASLLKMARSK